MKNSGQRLNKVLEYNLPFNGHHAVKNGSSDEEGQSCETIWQIPLLKYNHSVCFVAVALFELRDCVNFTNRVLKNILMLKPVPVHLDVKN